MHLLSSVFCQYPSAEITGYEVFSHPCWELKQFLWKIFQVFCIVLMKDKPSDIKIEKYDGKKISLMFCFNFFRNQLWQHLVSYNSFRNINMCLLKVAMCEKCRSSDFQSAKARRVKSLSTAGAGGLKNFRIAGGLSIWGVVLLLGHLYFITCNVTFIYLMTLLIVQNLKIIFTADTELCQWAIFGPNMDHLLQTNIFGKLLSFSSTY